MKAFLRISIAATLAFSSVAATGCGERSFTEAPAADGKGGEAKASEPGVTITVIDANSKPVKGAAVSLTDGSGKAIAADVAADSNGKATFTKVPAGKRYVATARFQGLSASHTLDVEGEEPVLVSILIAPANGLKGTIGGSVFDGYTNQPLHGATVTVLGTQAMARTNADGSYVIKDVPAGNPTIVAAYPGFGEQRAAVALRGGQLARADMRIRPATAGYRFGHTLIATQASIVEVDKVGSKLMGTRRGGFQARGLMNGNVLVANGTGVDEITTAGNVVWSFKPGLFGGLKGAQGVCRAASGNTFVADTGNNRVIEVSPSQQIARAIKFPFNKPASVERIEATKTTLVADAGGNRVIEVDDNGQMVWGFGDGSPTTLNKPSYATRLPNGNVLITDSGNSRILEITHTMNPGMAWSYGDGTRATCAFPGAATRTPTGTTLVADTGNHRVIEVSKDGEIVWTHAIDAPLFAERL